MSEVSNNSGAFETNQLSESASPKASKLGDVDMLKTIMFVWA